MKYLLIYLPTVISFIFGISSDVKFNVKDPVYYWLIGSFGGFLTGLLIMIIK